MTDQFAQTSAPRLGFGLGIKRIIAREILQLGIDEAIALDLGVDRCAMSSEALGDLQHRHLASCQRESCHGLQR